MFVSIVSPVISGLNMKGDTLRKIRSDKRQLWIDAIRDDIGELIKISTRYGCSNEEILKRIGLIDGIYIKIKLRLNPGEPEHIIFLKELDRIMWYINTGADVPKVSMDLFVEATQPLLKKEWNKVKKGL